MCSKQMAPVPRQLIPHAKPSQPQARPSSATVVRSIDEPNAFFSGSSIGRGLPGTSSARSRPNRGRTCNKPRISNTERRSPTATLVPSLVHARDFSYTPEVAVSRAELEAWATLKRNTPNTGNIGGGRSTIHSKCAGNLDRATACHTMWSSSGIGSSAIEYDSNRKAGSGGGGVGGGGRHGTTRPRPSSAQLQPSKGMDTLFDDLERLGPNCRARVATTTQGRSQQSWRAAAAATAAVGSVSGASARAAGDSDIGYSKKRRPASACRAANSRIVQPMEQDLDGCRRALAEHLAARKRENEHGRSDVSVR